MRRRTGRLRVAVGTAFERSPRRYGSPRIHRDLRDEDVRYASNDSTIHLSTEADQ